MGKRERERVSWERESVNGENKKVRSVSGEKERGVIGERWIEKRERKKKES